MKEKFDESGRIAAVFIEKGCNSSLKKIAKTGLNNRHSAGRI